MPTFMSNNSTTVEEPGKKEPSRMEEPHPPQADVRRPWCKPEATSISKFSILALGPTPGALENMTFSNKSL